MAEEANVAVRPMRRADLDAFALWGSHDDPLFVHYNARPLSSAQADDLWQFLSGAPDVRRPFAGLTGDRMAAVLMLRDFDRQAGSGDLGIMLDPSRVGRGLGRRILLAFVAVLAAEGFRRLRLDAAGYNQRAIAAYRASGFVETGERWEEPEPGIDLDALLQGPAAGVLSPHVRVEDGRFRTRIIQLERRLEPGMKDDPQP